MGNLGSVRNAMHYLDCPVQITDDPCTLEQASGLILPGVGAFDDCMSALEHHRLVEPLKELIAGGKPFLGICLGLQMLFERSEEGEKPGLGILPGRVERFKHDLKIPQIGWNQISIQQPAPPLAGIAEGAWFYFVHSYYVVPDDPSLIATTTDYGYEFCSALWRENIFACQFHPEKSQAPGLQMLRNFKGLTESQ